MVVKMQKIKRILALAGVFLLAGLYLATLLCAIFAKENFMQMLMASLYASVIIPVLMWAYSLIYRLVHKKDGDKATEEKN